jgi:hypothetical protein
MAKAKAKRTKPFSTDQHKKMGKALSELGGELMDMQESIGNSYPYSTEPARAVREMIRAYNKTRGALVSRFFGEGHSEDGTSPYYPPGMKPVKPDDPPESAEASGDDEEEEDGDEGE